MKKTVFTIFCMLTILLFKVQGQQENKTGIHTSKRVMKGFMDLRFGMFIHWGPVSLRGTEIGWSRDKQVSRQDYDNLYKEFDPVLFNADSIARVARDAGMKYLTITAKHHDGFCLWPSEYTDYTIASTPYKKDILGQLADACKKYGLKFCIYYSVLDWHHPDYPIHSAYNQTLDPKADMERYVSYMKNQLKELITRYRPYMLWFDGQWEKPWTNEKGREIYNYLKSLDPDVIVNNRLGKEFAAMENKQVDVSQMVGDYDTPERTVGRINMQMPWESCFTLCTQWAWKPNDSLQTLQTCLQTLARTAGANGNLLLNVGPMPDGRIEARQKKRLREIGVWLKNNGQAIYNTLGGPYKPNDQYTATRKGNNIYIFLLRNERNIMSLPAISGIKVLNARFMTGRRIPVTQDHDHIQLALPDSLPGADCPVIVLEMNKNVENIKLME